MIEVPQNELTQLFDALGEVARLVKPIKLQLALLHQSMNPQGSRLSVYLQSEEAQPLLLNKEEIKPHLEQFLLSTFDDINRIEQNARMVEQQLYQILQTDINFDREGYTATKPQIKCPNAAFKAHISRLETTLRILGQTCASDRELRPELVEERAVARLKAPEILSLAELVRQDPKVFMASRHEHTEMPIGRLQRVIEDCTLLEERNSALESEVTALKAQISGREAFLRKEIIREVRNLEK